MAPESDDDCLLARLTAAAGRARARIDPDGPEPESDHDCGACANDQHVWDDYNYACECCGIRAPFTSYLARLSGPAPLWEEWLAWRDRPRPAGLDLTR